MVPHPDRCPGSGLRLKYRDSFADQDLIRGIVRRFEANGIAADRLVFDGRRTSRRSHLAFVGGLDIALDPFPFNGSTTTYEALWMGVPVVTLLGKRFVGRVGAAFLGRVGLDDLIAADEDAYVDAAVALACDPERRARLRTGLRPELLASPSWMHRVMPARLKQPTAACGWTGSDTTAGLCVRNDSPASGLSLTRGLRSGI